MKSQNFKYKQYKNTKVFLVIVELLNKQNIEYEINKKCLNLTIFLSKNLHSLYQRTRLKLNYLMVNSSHCKN